jgi:hypothetical protein
MQMCEDVRGVGVVAGKVLLLREQHLGDDCQVVELGTSEIENLKR